MRERNNFNVLAYIIFDTYFKGPCYHTETHVYCLFFFNVCFTHLLLFLVAEIHEYMSLIGRESFYFVETAV